MGPLPAHDDRMDLVRGFPPTRHSALVAVRSADATERARGLATLSSVYWRPVYSYLRFRWRRPHEDAADLAQEFFAELVETICCRASILPGPACGRICASASMGW